MSGLSIYLVASTYSADSAAFLGARFAFGFSSAAASTAGAASATTSSFLIFFNYWLTLLRLSITRCIMIRLNFPLFTK